VKLVAVRVKVSGMPPDVLPLPLPLGSPRTVLTFAKSKPPTVDDPLPLIVQLLASAPPVPRPITVAPSPIRIQPNTRRALTISLLPR